MLSALTSQPCLLRLQKINKAYQNQPILNEIDLRVETGDFLALVGPSGAGKSTLLRILNLLEAPTAGTLSYQNQPVDFSQESKLLAYRRQMTMVMQRSVMLAGTVAQNVAVGLKLRKLPEPVIKERVADSLQFVGLAAFAQRKAATLSGGEMQRVALARAIALEPQLLLLDEPTANLDPQNVALVEELIKNIKTRLGATVVMVTHNMFQAKRLANQVVFLHQGKLIEQAPVSDFFENPQQPLTKAFISGAMVY